MGFFDDILGGLFGSDPEPNAAFPEELKELIDFGMGEAGNISGLAQGGFNMNALLMPLLFRELGIQPAIDKDGKITGFERVQDPNAGLLQNLETTTLKNLQRFSEGRGPMPEGVKARNKAARQSLKTQFRKAGFSRGDTPFEEAMSRLRTDIKIQNDAFRHGQFGVAANLLNQIQGSQRADLGMLLQGATGTSQSGLPFINALINNTGAISSLAGAASGGGQTQGEPGLLGTLLGGFAGQAAGAAGSAFGASLFACWVARAVYGDTNPRWLLFRRWLYAKAPFWFYRAYMRFGERVGRFVKHCPVVGTLIRPLMDRAIYGLVIR